METQRDFTIKWGFKMVQATRFLCQSFICGALHGRPCNNDCASYVLKNSLAVWPFIYNKFKLSLFLRFVPGYDGPLGCTMDRNGVTLSLWAPTALSVARQDVSFGVCLRLRPYSSLFRFPKTLPLSPTRFC